MARPADADLPRREERLRRVASEAARQCGRPDVPGVRVHPDLATAVAACPDLPRFLLDVRPGARSLAALSADAHGAVLAVGPEGSFTDDEVASLEAAGFAPAALGPRVLRAETAAIAAVIVVQAVAGDMR